jgi:hypothetical protein
LQEQETAILSLCEDLEQVDDADWIHERLRESDCHLVSALGSFVVSSRVSERALQLATKALFMLCSCDPESTRALLSAQIVAALQREIIRCIDSVSSCEQSFVVVIYLYCELCASAEALVDEAQHHLAIEALLSSNLRDVFLSSLESDSESLVHASTYALVHFHVLSAASHKQPSGLLAALPEHRFATWPPYAIPSF